MSEPTDPALVNAIVEALCSLALSDHLGDVRDAEESLWTILRAKELPWDHEAWDHDNAYFITAHRLKQAGYEPTYGMPDPEDYE